ncbi:hypothetical protein [Vibrio navarrensis]|uniref:hypothetical protein n=1 Tax=Vibrio navarrensis TaxID=29495 RepID=UPI00338F8C2C
MVDKKVITLSAQQTQIVLELGEYAEILHWGKKMGGELGGQTLSLYRGPSSEKSLADCLRFPCAFLCAHTARSSRR